MAQLDLAGSSLVLLCSHKHRCLVVDVPAQKQIVFCEIMAAEVVGGSQTVFESSLDDQSTIAERRIGLVVRAEHDSSISVAQLA